ncbi:unnamed protein product [Symbiodinium sp. CCMP2592]|nr:unnamed protein product [Symbiodinium sp. CCMP2592]
MPRARVGSGESNSNQSSVAERWRRLPMQQKKHFQEEAHKLQQAREEICKRKLGDVSSETSSGLRGSQLKRLNRARLTTSVKDIADLEVWKTGLQVADHASPLQAKHVLSGMSDAEFVEELKKVFGYDRDVVPNPAVPQFLRSCEWHHCGICQQDELFENSQTLMRQYDQQLHAKHLGTVPVIACIRSDQMSQWFFQGCVCKRPVPLHIGLHLWVRKPCCLCMSVVDGRPRLSSVQQMLLVSLRKHVAAGGSFDDFDVVAPRLVEFYQSFSSYHEDADLVLALPSLDATQSFHLGLGYAPAVREGPAAGRKTTSLPFGMANILKKFQKKESTSRQSAVVGGTKGPKAAASASSADVGVPDSAVDGGDGPAATGASSSQMPRSTLEADESPMILSVSAELELAAAVREEADLALDGSQGVAKPTSSASGQASSSAMVAPHTGVTFHGQSRLGIQDVGKASRRGMICLHCHNGIDKGAVRFVYAFKHNKPARSIHPDCLSQISPACVGPSVTVLRKLLQNQSRSFSAGEIDACRAALSALEVLDS